MPIRELSSRFWGVPEARGEGRSPLLGPYRWSVFRAKPAGLAISPPSSWPHCAVPLPSWLDTKERTAWVYGA
jgi:hypothetical protein